MPASLPIMEMVFNWAESPGPEILEILGGLCAAMEEESSVAGVV